MVEASQYHFVLLLRSHHQLDDGGCFQKPAHRSSPRVSVASDFLRLGAASIMDYKYLFSLRWQNAIDAEPWRRCGESGDSHFGLSDPCHLLLHHCAPRLGKIAAPEYFLLHFLRHLLLYVGIRTCGLDFLMENWSIRTFRKESISYLLRPVGQWAIRSVAWPTQFRQYSVTRGYCVLARPSAVRQPRRRASSGTNRLDHT